MKRVERSRPSPVEISRVFRLAQRAASLPDVQAEVEANHDNNRWWPTSITDTRMRMLAAGWSTRVSYRMITTYADVINAADTRGFDTLATSTDAELTALIQPIGLPRARIGYLRSLTDLLQHWDKEAVSPTAADADTDELIRAFATHVRGASYKVAQCALLYARGYHCGIIPVDSGMVTRLAPALGVPLPRGPVAHEQLRHLLEATAHTRADDLRTLISKHQYDVKIPETAPPTWWLHLVLIYLKRLHLNRPSHRICPNRPVCLQTIDCPHTRP